MYHEVAGRMAARKVRIAEEVELTEGGEGSGGGGGARTKGGARKGAYVCAFASLCLSLSRGLYTRDHVIQLNSNRPNETRRGPGLGVDLYGGDGG